MSFRERQRTGNYEDEHHILHSRQEWELRPEACRLRRNHTLIARMEVDAHKELHANCPAVPPLGFFVLMKTVRLFEPVRNTITSVENLQSAIEQAARMPRTHPIERDMSELTVEALELQKPYLGDIKAKSYFDMRIEGFEL